MNEKVAALVQQHEAIVAAQIVVALAALESETDPIRVDALRQTLRDLRSLTVALDSVGREARSAA